MHAYVLRISNHRILAILWPTDMPHWDLMFAILSVWDVLTIENESIPTSRTSIKSAVQRLPSSPKPPHLFLMARRGTPGAALPNREDPSSLGNPTHLYALTARTLSSSLAPSVIFALIKGPSGNHCLSGVPNVSRIASPPHES